MSCVVVRAVPVGVVISQRHWLRACRCRRVNVRAMVIDSSIGVGSSPSSCRGWLWSEAARTQALVPTTKCVGLLLWSFLKVVKLVFAFSTKLSQTAVVCMWFEHFKVARGGQGVCRRRRPSSSIAEREVRERVRPSTTQARGKSRQFHSCW